MESRIRILQLAGQKSEAKRVLRAYEDLHPNATLRFVNSKQSLAKALDIFKPTHLIIDLASSAIRLDDLLLLLKNKKLLLPLLMLDSNTAANLPGTTDVQNLIRLEELPQRLPDFLNTPVSGSTAEKPKDTLGGGERIYKALLESSREAIILRDENYNIMYRSPSAEKMTGWSLNELKKMSFIELIHPEDRQSIVEVVSAIRHQEGKPLNVIYRNLHKNGHYVWIEMTLTNLLRHPDVGGIVCNLRDITEYKKIENDIRRSNNHFKALMENIADAIVLTDRNGTITYYSQSGEAMTGYSQTEKIGGNILDCLHKEDLAIAKSIFRSLVLEPNVKLHRSFRVRRKDANYIWVEGSVTNMLRDESVGAIVFNFRDITARRASERRLEKSEANLRSIFDNTNVSYVLVNLDYKIVSFNQQAKSRYRTEIAANIEEGASIIDYLPEFRKDDMFQIFNKVLGGEKHWYEKEFVHNEEVSWYSVNMFPVYNENKKILGLIIASEDITDRKLAELEKEQMTADLIQHNKNLEQFAYIITHNLRSPVANIVGLSSIMSSTPNMPAADFEKCLEGLTTSVKKLDEVIIDLNFILQNRKEVNNQKEAIELTGLLDDIKALTGELIEKEDVLIRTRFEIKQVFTVKSYLHSVFLNLITNSIKYRQPNLQPTIDIHSFIEGDELVLRFRDNGLGIDLNSNGSKLFGLYKRFHKHVEGKGMGLYMVKTQVEMLGGKISVESSPNQGSTFELRFPESIVAP